MIKIIYEKNKSTIQSVIFSKDKWSLEDAEKWLKDNGYKYSKMDEKEKTYRFRQEDPKLFKFFRYSKEIKPGLKFDYGIK